MTQWIGDNISGIDGKYLLEHYLMDEEAKENPGPRDFRPATLEESCRTKMGIHCSSFVFCHCDLAPVLSLSMIEQSGSLTGRLRAMSRGRMGCDQALGFCWDGSGNLPPGCTEHPHAYARAFYKGLTDQGFEDHRIEFMKLEGLWVDKK